jgi:hypothetical protein
MYAPNLQVKAIDGRLKCHAVGAPAGAELAFYVLRNGKRVHASGYSSNRGLGVNVGPGYYQVECFTRMPDGATVRVSSAPIFSQPLTVTPDEFPNADHSRTTFTLRGERWDIPALYFPGQQSTLYVMLPAAIDAKRVGQPSFSRWTWAHKGIFPGNVLCISDPTLDLHPGLRLGWMLGRHDRCATDELSRFVTALADAKGISHNRIVCWGSSAGGFAALALAAGIPGATAVAVNPQVNALSYENFAQVELIRTACFDSLDSSAILGRYGRRVNMVERWSDVSRSRAIVLQNELDTHHYIDHFKPMVESIGGEVRQGISGFGRHRAWVFQDARGHVAETEDMARKVVQMLDINEAAVEA